MVERLEALKVYRALPWTFDVLSQLASPDIEPQVHTAPDYFGHFAEDKVPSGRTLGVGRMDGSPGGGADLIEQCEKFLLANKCPVMANHRVSDLLRNALGEITGVIADNACRRLRIRARKAVIFGTGGFAHNPHLVDAFHKTRCFGSCAAPGARGDFIPIAGRAGAALSNMSSSWGGQVIVEQAVENPVLPGVVFLPVGDSMLIVNKYGKRFADEYRSYNSRLKSHEAHNSTEEEYSNHLAFMVFDHRAIDMFGGPGRPVPAPGETPSWLITADTLEALESGIRPRLQKLRVHSVSTELSSDFTPGLRATIERFNQYAEAGVDADFGRGKYTYDREVFLAASPPRNAEKAKGYRPSRNPTMHPISADGPYYAIILGKGALDTNGGPIINAKAQIINYSGAPIRRLYGAGNCIASPTREAYYGSGGSIGPAMTFGFIAANNAHHENVKAL